LFPAVLDDYVGEDNPVRAVDVFVDGLDLDKLGFVGVQPLDMVLGVWPRRRLDLLAPFRGNKPYCNLTIESCETSELMDPAWKLRAGSAEPIAIRGALEPVSRRGPKPSSTQGGNLSR
jgi:hypothetical protein